MYLILLPPILSKVVFFILTFVFVLPGQFIFSFINEPVGTFIMSIGGIFFEESFLPEFYGNTILAHYVIGLILIAIAKFGEYHKNKKDKS